MSNDTFLLAEAPFSSLQCEGKTINKFSYFIRLFGCNYDCSFCDTKFAWDKAYDGISYNVDSLRDTFIKEYLKNVTGIVVKNIVFTGGEPLLWQKQINKFIEGIPYDDASYEFETNGAIELKKELLYTLSRIPNKAKNVLFNISPKTQFLFEKDFSILKENIKFLNILGIPFILKFVDEESNRPQIQECINSLRGLISFNQIYIMPECQTREEHLTKFESTLEWCKIKGFNFSPRLHILLWDNKKGV